MEIKEYEDDEIEIQKLFRLAFSKGFPEGYWSWRFRKNPFLQTPMVNLMWEKEKLIGHSGLIALELIVNNRKVLAGLSGTAMTHPEFEHRGIFSTLALDLYQKASQTKDLKVVMGFPNKKSHYSIVKKVGRKDVGIIANLALNAGTFSSDAHLVTKINKIGEFSEAHEKFIEGRLSRLGFSVWVNRSASYLNWRYMDCPIAEYNCFEVHRNNELAGVVVTKEYQPSPTEKTEVDVVEIFCDAEVDILAEIFTQVRLAYANAGTTVGRFNLWMSLFDPRHVLLEKIGFEPGLPITYMSVKAFSPEVEEVYDFRNWYISMGDSDNY